MPSVSSDHPVLIPIVAAIQTELRKAAPTDPTMTNDVIVAMAAQDAVGNLIQQLDADKKRAVQRLTLKAYNEGWDADKLSRAINRIMDLDPTDEYAVEAYHRGLEAAGEGKGKAARLARQYADRLRIQRSRTIARTELANLVGEAKRRVWIEARRQGLIDQYAVRVWHTARDERMCPICRPMNGQRASLTGTYMGGLKGPPVHPNCRCSEWLVRGAVVLDKEHRLDEGFKYRSLV